MDVRLERKDSIATIGEAIEWLRRNPVLILAFFVVGVVESLGEEVVALSLLGFLLLIFVDGIAHRFAFAEARGTSTTIGDEAGPVLERFLSLIGAWIVYSIAVVIGLLLLILPGIYLALRLSLAFPAIVIDDERAFDGLSTSWDVAQGNLLKLFGITVLAMIVAFSTLIVAAIFTVAFESIALLVLISAVVTAILSPIVQLAYARVYLENRTDGSDGVVADDGWNGDERTTRETEETWGSEDEWNAERDDRDTRTGRDNRDNRAGRDDRDDTHW